MSIELTPRGHELWKQGYHAGFEDGTRYGLTDEKPAERTARPKVRLYLDFDGVINVPHPERVWPHSAYSVGVAYGEPVLLPKDNTRFDLLWADDLIADLSALNVELVWATTWTESAPTVLADQLGIGLGARFLTPLDGVLRYPTIDWKHEAVWADQEESPCPFIWVDDEIDSRARNIGMPSSPSATLLINPYPEVGLTPDHIRQMQDFITEQKEPVV
jgi:hypothetical protein